MIRLACRPEALGRIRFAVSPLWECIASLRAIRRLETSARPPLQSDWLARLRGRAPRRFPPLMGSLLDHAGAYLADFLAPPPAAPEPDIEAELRRLRTTPPRIIARELARMPGIPVDLRRDPRQIARRVADELFDWWSRVLAREWPGIRAVVQRDIIVRARRLALEGAGVVLNELHPDCRFHRDTILIRSRRNLARSLRGTSLVLVPGVYGWPELFVVADSPWRPTIAYPAQGVGVPSAVSAGSRQRLELLLGPARARVLLALREPATTADLAARLGLTAPGISQHLSRLRAAGLLNSMRVGKFVFHEMTSRGRGVMAAFP
jgi:hypothetical protein